MLEKLDLKQKLDKKEYDKKMDYYGDLLGKLQRECRAAKVPVIVLVEGWRGAMRTDIINEMMQKMDSRGFRVFSASKMTDEQRRQPFFYILLETASELRQYCSIPPQLVLFKK